jgi:hypothetical protein
LNTDPQQFYILKIKPLLQEYFTRYIFFTSFIDTPIVPLCTYTFTPEETIKLVSDKLQSLRTLSTSYTHKYSDVSVVETNLLPHTQDLVRRLTLVTNGTVNTYGFIVDDYDKPEFYLRGKQDEFSRLLKWTIFRATSDMKDVYPSDDPIGGFDVRLGQV